MAACRFRFRSSSSSSISLIKTSKLAMDRFGGEVVLIRIAGRVAPGRMGGVMSGCTGDEGLESLPDFTDALDFKDAAPPRRWFRRC